jgi:hypothetical protein
MMAMPMYNNYRMFYVQFFLKECFSLCWAVLLPLCSDALLYNQAQRSWAVSFWRAEPVA